MRGTPGILNRGALVAAVGMLWATAALGGGIEGRGRFEKIKGKPSMGYIELYESNLFLSPSALNTVGPSRRLGTTYLSGSSCIIDTVGNGAYCIDNMTAGNYSILVNQPLFFVAPKVLPDVPIGGTGFTNVNVELGIDYSTFYKNDWTYLANSMWYQTFTATGVSIRGVAFSYAGNDPSYIAVGLLEDNGSPDVRSWPVIAERADYSVHDVTDNWVRFRSAEAPTVPGHRYAIRLMAVGAAIQPYKRNKDSNSYASGRAYDANGVAQNFDMNITVFSDNDGTTVTMNKRTEGSGDLVDGYFASKWGQTFVARAASLAAVDVWAAGADHQWDLDFTWKIYPATDPTGPTGTPISPTKTTKAAYQSFGMGLHGVSYRPNEVRLVPGQTYFVEFSATNPPPSSPGFNPYVMGDDSYSQGMGYRWTGTSWDPQPTADLAMTIIEYMPQNPLMVVSPESVSKRAFYTGNPPPTTFTVNNGGNGTFNYTVQSSAAWLSVSPSQGSCTTETDTITVTFATSGLALGNYDAVITLESAEAENSPVTIPVALVVTTVPPDLDHDTDVDLSDFGRLQKCFSGSGISQAEPACQSARLDPDDDVDQDDVAAFLACFSGPGVIANPSCAIP